MREFTTAEQTMITLIPAELATKEMTEWKEAMLRYLGFQVFNDKAVQFCQDFFANASSEQDDYNLEDENNLRAIMTPEEAKVTLETVLNDENKMDDIFHVMHDLGILKFSSFPLEVKKVVKEQKLDPKTFTFTIFLDAMKKVADDLADEAFFHEWWKTKLEENVVIMADFIKNHAPEAWFNGFNEQLPPNEVSAKVERFMQKMLTTATQGEMTKFMMLLMHLLISALGEAYFQDKMVAIADENKGKTAEELKMILIHTLQSEKNSKEQFLDFIKNNEVLVKSIFNYFNNPENVALPHLQDEMIEMMLEMEVSLLEIVLVQGRDLRQELPLMFPNEADFTSFLSDLVDRFLANKQMIS